MNSAHLTALSSPEWAQALETDLLPWVEAAGRLGDDVLEVGPGPGLTTDLLRQRVDRLTAVEIDRTLADKLADRLADSNVDVLCADATRSGLPANRFSAATCFSMLHHMPSADQQNTLFAEIHRLLRPGGILVGADAVDRDDLRAFHEDDTFVPIDPSTLTRRLAAAGFGKTTIDVSDYQFRFVTNKPA